MKSKAEEEFESAVDVWRRLGLHSGYRTVKTVSLSRRTAPSIICSYLAAILSMYFPFSVSVLCAID